MNRLDIYTAEEAGFCFGVKRAVQSAKKKARDSTNNSVYSLGPIIHNPQVVKKLEDLGIKTIQSIDEVEQGTVIIRSHGIAPDILKKAKEKGLDILDATCPFVKNAQKFARQLINEGYQTIIYGDHKHPEVIGIYGATDKKAYIVSNKKELDSLKLSKKIGFVAQTTKSPASYRELISSIIEKINELKVFNTICNTTETRQQSASELARKVDLMVVIGGHNSANTNRLAEICAQTTTPTYHIETAAEIKHQWLEGKKKIGITAGASTPDWLIKEVIEAMSEEKKDLQTNEENKVEGVNNETEEVLENETIKEPTSIDSTVEESINDSEESIEDVESESNSVDKTSPEDKGDAEDSNNETAIDELTEDEDSEEKKVEVNTDTDESPDEEEDNTGDTVTNEPEMVDYSVNDIADLKKGQLVKGTVSQIKEDGVYVDVNYKTDGFIPLRELSHRNISDPEEVVELNDEINVVILTLEDDEGNMILSKKRADFEKAWEKIMEVYENDETIEAEVTKVVKGGLVVDVGLRGFVPASHVAIGYVENLEDYVGEKLKLKVIEVERDRNNVVLSARAVLEAKRKNQKKETLENLEEGKTMEGQITKLVDFGAFVDLGGIEGLLHISEMSWGRIGHPREVFEEGQTIEVKILSIDEEEERISLGYKQLLPDPWEEFVRKHYEGEIVSGKVTKLVDFGAFVEIENGVEGLIHISQLSHRHVKTPDEVVSENEEIQVKIISINEEQKRVGLSIKELEERPDKQSNKPQQKKNSDTSSNNEDNPGVTIRDLVGDIFENDKE